jgi:hypothetical protein
LRTQPGVAAAYHSQKETNTLLPKDANCHNWVLAAGHVRLDLFPKVTVFSFVSVLIAPDPFVVFLLIRKYNRQKAMQVDDFS